LKSDEARTTSVVEGVSKVKDARTIVCGSFCHLFLSAAYLATMIQGLVTLSYTSSMFFVNPYIDQLPFIRYVEAITGSVNPRVFCFDVKKYDIDLPYAFTQAATQVILNVTNYSGYHLRILTSLLKYFTMNVRGYPVKDSMGKFTSTNFYSSATGLPSGHYCTNLIGSLATVLMWHYVLRKYFSQVLLCGYNDPRIDTYISRIVILGHGDDSFIAFPVEWDSLISPHDIEALFLEFGVRLQSSDKTSLLSSSSLYGDLDKMEFLSRSIVIIPHPFLPSKQYNFALHLKNIVKSLSFMDPKRRKHKSELTEYFDNICIEISLHGESKFLEYMVPLSVFFLEFDCVPPSSLSYRAAVERRKLMVGYVW
jgi:hypothetical protein